MTSSPKDPWITIIGMQENGAFDERALPYIIQSHYMMGAPYRTAFIEEHDDITIPCVPFVTPFMDNIRHIEQHHGEHVTIIASGDPLFFGVARTIINKFGDDAVRVFPAISIVSLACSRLKWPQESLQAFSIHGRDIRHIIPHLHPKKRMVILTSHQHDISALAQLLTKKNYGDSRMHILSNIGFDDEAHHTMLANKPLSADTINNISPLNIIGLELCEHGQYIGGQTGLDSTYFMHDNVYSKAEVRAIIMSKLALYNHAILWDVGAGNGTIAAEACLQGAHSYAFERHQERIKNMYHNIQDLGLKHMHVIEGDMHNMAVFDDIMLPSPDAIFIGGGMLNIQQIEILWHRLAIYGRLVMAAASSEGHEICRQLYHVYGGDIIQISISHYSNLGQYHQFKPNNMITLYHGVKHA